MLALGVFSADTTYAEPHLKLPILCINDANLSILNRVRILTFLIFKLAARRRNVATTRISHGCFDARAFERSNERIDAMFGGRPKRGARNIIEGQQIHVGGNALAEIDERLQVVVVVIEAFDKKIFERNSTATIVLVFLNYTM